MMADVKLWLTFSWEKFTMFQVFGFEVAFVLRITDEEWALKYLRNGSDVYLLRWLGFFYIFLLFSLFDCILDEKILSVAFL